MITNSGNVRVIVTSPVEEVWKVTKVGNFVFKKRISNGTEREAQSKRSGARPRHSSTQGRAEPLTVRHKFEEDEACMNYLQRVIIEILSGVFIVALYVLVVYFFYF